MLNTGYVFNGVEDIYNLFDKTQYIIDDFAGAKFLNKWNGKRRIHLADKGNVQFLQGNFGYGNISNLDSFDIIVTSKSGVVVTTNKDISFTQTPQIVSIDISPSSLNTIPGVVINEDTLHYTIVGESGSTKELTFEVYDVDSRFDEYFRIAYVDLYGTTDYVNFDLVNTNELSVKRKTFSNNNKRKSL